MKSGFQVLSTATLAASLWAALWGCSTNNDSPTGSTSGCTSNTQCLNGQECSGGKCVPFTSCPAVACGAGQSCVQGACRAACTADAQCGALVCNVAQGVCQPAPNPVGTAGSGSGGSPGVGGTPSVGGTPGVGGTPATAGSGPTAGSASGGTAGAAGSQGTGGVVNPGEGPPGYVVEKDWHGCAWTGVGDLGASMITTPASKDFTAKAPADPFCMAGTVGAEPAYKSVALLGFNVAEPPTSANCTYKPVDANAAGPPSVVPTAAGLAINFVKRGADTSFTLRVQIQGPNGAKPDPVGAMDRWCATLTETQGKIFVPWANFTPSCWETTDAKKGTPYAKQPISAIVFSVPGKPTAVPFDFCVNGFVQGAAATDAPDGPAVAGDQKGTVGTDINPDGDFARAKVTVDGHDYIIQNNNWGNPGGSLILDYVNNSFKIKSGTGTGGDAPASFPSIFIGGNGNTANGVYSTHPKDNLPVKVSDIKSAISTFRYSGTTNVFNAAYDIWFANAIPTAEYKDGINGFVMVWLRDPSGKQPIGTKQGTATVAGQAWDVYKGPRGAGPAGNNDAPVISFVNPAENDNSRAQTFKDVDLTGFFTAAQQYGIAPSMYLTDVFAGFEIWDGGAGGNLSVDEFKAVITK
jgi:hypothetical protein